MNYIILLIITAVGASFSVMGSFIIGLQIQIKTKLANYYEYFRTMIKLGFNARKTDI